MIDERKEGTREETVVTDVGGIMIEMLNLMIQIRYVCTRWFKYDRDRFVCKQAALRSSCATLRE